MQDRLGLFDEVSRTSLKLEIHQLALDGVRVEVGQADDSAFRDLDAIERVFRHLRSLDERLAAIEVPAVNWYDTPRARKKARRAHEAHRERARIDWLFGPDATDSIPWHEQRGRAAALLTITSAHELSDETGMREHPTMSGPLSKRVLDVSFGSSVPHIGGLGLEQAVLVAETRFSGRPRHDAERIAAKRVAQLGEFLQATCNSRFRETVRYCTDSIGIRSRRALVAERIHQALREIDHPDPLLMSFGCGTALPMLEVLRDWKRANAGVGAPRLILLDQDPLALAAATTLAEDMGLADDIEVHNQRLFDRFGRPLDFQQVLRGRLLHVAEDSGLREYLPDRIYRWLTRSTWEALAPGGLMSTGNMNTARPQPEFLHGMMGWKPKVQMRTIRQGLHLHAQAGVPEGATTARLTPEGVYTLFFSTKR